MWLGLIRFRQQVELTTDSTNKLATLIGSILTEFFRPSTACRKVYDCTFTASGFVISFLVRDIPT